MSSAGQFGERFDSLPALREAVHARCWATLDAVAAGTVDRQVLTARLLPYGPTADTPLAVTDEAARHVAAVRDALAAADAYLTANPGIVDSNLDAASLDELLSRGGEWNMNRPDRNADGSSRAPNAPLRANDVRVIGAVRLWLAFKQRSEWDRRRELLDARSRQKAEDPSADIAIDLLISARGASVEGKSRGRLVHAAHRFGQLGAEPGELPAVATLVALSLLAGHFPERCEADQRKKGNDRPTVADVVEAEGKTIALLVSRLPARRLASLEG